MGLHPRREGPPPPVGGATLEEDSAPQEVEEGGEDRGWFAWFKGRGEDTDHRDWTVTVCKMYQCVLRCTYIWRGVTASHVGEESWRTSHLGQKVGVYVELSTRDKQVNSWQGCKRLLLGFEPVLMSACICLAFFIHCSLTILHMDAEKADL